MLRLVVRGTAAVSLRPRLGLTRNVIPRTRPFSITSVLHSDVGVMPSDAPPLPNIPEVSWLQALSSEWAPDLDKVALVDMSIEGGRSTTYGELDRWIRGTANALHAKGLRQGDVLNIHLHNCTEFVVAMMAASEIGAIVTTSNPLYTATELAGQQVCQWLCRNWKLLCLRLLRINLPSSGVDTI